MLLQRGHGRILSGFFRVFSCELLVSLCSSSVFDVFNAALSFSMEVVLWFSLVAEVASGFESSSVATGETPSSCFSVSCFSTGS
ncbi:hypothetical protein OIU84_015482 [Salix udensis]|uniref:Uncharacterized protein n=1 Tax=Salix udensis TaxID=889485 RepID=A0AAD6NSL5_9ROSI|nr:hypothetical protein OIU84_015482 [Salix udensis]